MNRSEYIKSVIPAPAEIAAAAGVKEGEVGLMLPEGNGVLVFGMECIPDGLSFTAFMAVFKESGCLIFKDGYNPDTVKLVEL